VRGLRIGKQRRVRADHRAERVPFPVRVVVDHLAGGVVGDLLDQLLRLRARAAGLGRARERRALA